MISAVNLTDSKFTQFTDLWACLYVAAGAGGAVILHALAKGRGCAHYGRRHSLVSKLSPPQSGKNQTEWQQSLLLSVPCL